MSLLTLAGRAGSPQHVSAAALFLTNRSRSSELLGSVNDELPELHRAAASGSNVSPWSERAAYEEVLARSSNVDELKDSTSKLLADSAKLRQSSKELNDGIVGKLLASK